MSKPNHRGVFVDVAIQRVSPATVRVAVREGRALGGDRWTVFCYGESDYVAAEHVVRYQATRLTRVQMISGNPDQGRRRRRCEWFELGDGRVGDWIGMPVGQGDS